MTLKCLAIVRVLEMDDTTRWYVELRFGTDGEEECGPFDTESLAVLVATGIRDLPADRAPGEPFVFPNARVPIKLSDGTAAPPHDYKSACRLWGGA